MLRGGKEFFRSKAVRQALAYGLNVNAVIEKVLAGEAVRMLGTTHPQSWAYDPTGLNAYGYDPTRAEALLRQDGWRRGSDGMYQKAGQRLAFTITTFDAPDTVALQQEAMQQCGQIGIQVTAEVQDPAAFFQRLTQPADYASQGSRDLDAWIVRLALGADPDMYGVFHSTAIIGGDNVGGYSNPAVDQALEDGRARCAVADREAALHSVDQLLNEDQPYLFAFAANAFEAFNKRLQGVEPTPFNFFANAHRWWLSG